MSSMDVAEAPLDFVDFASRPSYALAVRREKAPTTQRVRALRMLSVAAAGLMSAAWLAAARGGLAFLVLGG